jgi:hypothetical protein
MIINQDDNLVVPEKTIAIFPIIPDPGVEAFDMNYSSFLKPLNTDHKREWFDKNFYRCLPLSIGNMQGFSVSVPFNFDVLWNGGQSPDDLSIYVYHTSSEYDKIKNTNSISVGSEFGHGILTIHFPVQLKTPPGINLMTIAPPNFPVPGMSPMTGVVEADNLRFTFTINLKIDLPNVLIKVIENSPLAGIIPIPRYFCDSFELKNATDIFSEEVVNDEIKTVSEHGMVRTYYQLNDLGSDRIYYSGKDVRGNKFKDHQLPKNIKHT